MLKGKMSILMISLVKMEEIGIGDVPDRLMEYGNYLSRLFIIMRSLDGNSKPIKCSHNVFIIPAFSPNLPVFIYNGYKIASKIFKTEIIDVIEVQEPILTGFLGYLIKKKYDIPLCVDLHGDYLGNTYWLKENKLNYLLNILGKCIVRKADGVRVVSSKIRKYLESNLGIPSEKIYHIPVFVNVDKLMKNKHGHEIRQKYSDYEHIILFVGRLSKEKKVGNLLQAAKIVLERYPKTLFLIVGDGKERLKLKKLSCKLKIEKNVVFEGYVPHNSIASYYYSSDLFVLPSNYEGRPISVIEASICGKPVISTDTSARDVIINGETGYIVPINNSNALAKKIIRLLDNPEKRSKMGKAGREYVKEVNDIKKNVKNLIQMYEDLCRGEFDDRVRARSCPSHAH